MNRVHDLRVDRFGFGILIRDLHGGTDGVASPRVRRLHHEAQAHEYRRDRAGLGSQQAAQPRVRCMQSLGSEHACEKRAHSPDGACQATRAGRGEVRGARAHEWERVGHDRQELDPTVRQLVGQPPLRRMSVLGLADRDHQRLGHILGGHDRKVDAQRNLRLEPAAYAGPRLREIIAARDDKQAIFRHGPRGHLQAGELVG